MRKKAISQARLKLRIPMSLAVKWGFDDVTLKSTNGIKIKSSEYLRNAISEAIKKDFIQIQSDIFKAPNERIIEKTIWVQEDLRNLILNKCQNCAMNTFLLILLESFFMQNDQKQDLEQRVMTLEKKLNELREEIWFLSVENDLNMKSRYDPQKFFD